MFINYITDIFKKDRLLPACLQITKEAVMKSVNNATNRKKKKFELLMHFLHFNNHQKLDQVMFYIPVKYRYSVQKLN